MSTNRDEQWLTVAEAVKIIHKLENTIIYWCRTGELSAIPTEFGAKISWRIPLSAVLAKQERLKDKKQNKINQKIPKKREWNKRIVKREYARWFAVGE